MRLLALIIALVWIAAVAWFGWQSLPQLPLDASAGDPATLEALNAARAKHALVYAVIGFVPAIIVVWLGRWLSR